MKSILLVLALISVNGFCQFNKSDIEDLKADLTNYANSKCANDQYLNSATSIMGKMSSPLSSSITPEQAKANDQLRVALSGVREGIMAGMTGNQASCKEKILDGVKKLDTLPVKVKTGNPVVPAKELPAVTS